MKGLPVSIQTFEKIRENGLTYVDKTDYIHQLVSQNAYFFLARPRRFGKSLLLTTIKSYFEGRKDLFDGLYIAEKEKEWEKYPIIHIDYSLIEYARGDEIFLNSLLFHLQQRARRSEIDLAAKSVSDAFEELIISLYKKYNQKVVILIDEYDKPMVDVLTEPKRFRENRAVLAKFYGAMKGLDHYFRFVMLTGISRFAKANVFSGMNNLRDISMDDNFSCIVGFTEEELNHYFPELIQDVADKFKVELAVIKQEIRRMYNGFSWNGKDRLYNPFSIFNFFLDREFGNYWFFSGTPSFLIELIRAEKFIPSQLELIETPDLEGYTKDVNYLPIGPLLFQTGYLTIKKIRYEGFQQIFHLDYPNAEVRISFIRYLLADFTRKQQHQISPATSGLKDALRTENFDRFITILQAFISDIPARLHLPKEAYYHSICYMILRLLGVQLLLEKETSKGRIDAVLELTDKVYIIEFKFGKEGGRIKRVETLAQKAIEQIQKNKYAEAYRADDRKVILFGIGFLNKSLYGKAVSLQNK
ncbi:MAG: AAA family ATPase [Bacteroidota bacterium]